MSRPPRLAASSYATGSPFFLTICTYGRHQYFRETAVVTLVLLQFLHVAEKQHVEIWTYCFMPDHLHLLVTAPGCDVRRFVHSAKQHSAFQFSRAHRMRLWQEGFYDRALREDEPAERVMEYIVNNPLRAGIADDIRAYAHWGSSVWTRDDLIEFFANKPDRHAGPEGPAYETRIEVPALKGRPTKSGSRCRP